MSDSKTDLKSIINSYEKSETFNSKYDFDIWFTFIIIVAVLIFVCRIYLLNFFKSEKENWKNNKCNPAYIPFGKNITNSKDENFNMNNLNNCINDSLYELWDFIFEPLKMILAGLASMFSVFINLFTQFIEFIKWLFKLIGIIFEYILNYINAIVGALISLFNNLQNGLSNFMSSFTILYFTFQMTIKTLLYIAFILAYGFFVVICIPAMIMFIVALILLIIMTIICAVLSAIFCAGCWACPLSLGINLVMMLVSLAFMIFVFILFFTLKRFAEQVTIKADGKLPNTRNMGGVVEQAEEHSNPNGGNPPNPHASLYPDPE